MTFAEFVWRRFGGVLWQSKQDSSDATVWLSALINRLIICPWNLCGARDSQTFLRMIYTAVNNLCCPLLASSVSALLIKSRRLSGPKAGAQWTCSLQLQMFAHRTCRSLSLLLCCSNMHPQFVFKGWPNYTCYFPSDFFIVTTIYFFTSVIC